MKNIQKGFIVPLLIAIIAVLVVGGGVYYIYLNGQALSIQPPTINEINNQSTSTQGDAIIATTSSPSKVVSNTPVNCGVSKLLGDTSKSIFNAKPTEFDSDPAFACLGKSLLNNCAPAYLTSKTGERFEVANVKSSCVLKLKSQNVGFITTANTCVVNDILKYERAHPIPNDPFGIPLNNPSLHQGGYAGMFYLLAKMSPITDENGLTCPGTTLNDVNKAIDVINNNQKSNLPPLKAPSTVWNIQDNSKITTIPVDQPYKVNFTDGSSCTLSSTQSFSSVENGQDKLDILRTVDCVGGPRLGGNAQREGKPNTYGCTIYQSGSGMYDTAALSKPYVQSFTLTCRVAK